MSRSYRLAQAEKLLEHIHKYIKDRTPPEDWASEIEAEIAEFLELEEEA